MKYELNKNYNSKKLYIGLSILFCTAFLIIGTTTAFFTQSGIEITGNIVSVDKVSLNYTDNTNYMRSNLIPAVEQDVPKFAMKNSLNDNKYTEDDICHYKDNMYACSLYEFTIENTINASQSISVSMFPTLNQYNNLYFILYEGKANELKENSKVIEHNRKIEQDTINFDNLNLVLKGNESITYTIVFYVKNLEYAQDDAGKRFAASISVNSITTGYSVATQVGEGCYESVKLDDGTYKLTRFNGINHQTRDIVEGCGVTKDGDYYSVTVPSTYGGNTISTLGNSLFYPIYLEDFDTNDLTPIAISKHYYIKELKINEGITTIEDGIYLGNIQPFGQLNMGLLSSGGINASTQQPLNEDGVKISLPNSLKYIGNYAFNLSLIKDIRLPNNLEYMGNRAFANNPYLTEIYIPASVKEIGEYVTGGSYNIKKLVFEDTKDNPSHLIKIGAFTFVGKQIESLVIPSSVKIIGESAFSSNRKLTKLIIVDTETNPSKLEEIGEMAFNNCDLTYTDSKNPLVIPSSVTQIGSSAFVSYSNGTDYEPRNRNLKFIRYEGTLLDGNPTNWYDSNTILNPPIEEE